MFGLGKKKNNLPSKVFGVDFSGGTYASKKTWIAEGEVKKNHLHIKTCMQAERLPGGSTDRDDTYCVLREFIKNAGSSVFAMDFPFGLAMETLRSRKIESWHSFVTTFPWEFKEPEDFHQSLLNEAGGKEPKRVTDVEAKAPFSPINLWIYRQTFFGVKDIIKPLLKDDLARMLPMQEREDGKPWLIEACPASFLKEKKIYHQYKGAKGEFDRDREAMLESLKDMGLSLDDDGVIKSVVEDKGGDAIDAIICAFIAFKAITGQIKLEPGYNETYSMEGYIYY